MKHRKSTRAILLNDLDQVLLIQHQDEIPADPANPDILAYWATPGGGIESGESSIEALKRELLEELGLEHVVVGRQIGVREVPLKLSLEDAVISHETYFVCRVSEKPQLNHLRMSEIERKNIRAIKWWSREELRNSTETFRPAQLTELVESALHQGTDLIMISE